MRSKTKVIIAIIIILVVFAIGMIIIISNKLSSDEPNESNNSIGSNSSVESNYTSGNNNTSDTDSNTDSNIENDSSTSLGEAISTTNNSKPDTPTDSNNSSTNSQIDLTSSDLIPDYVRPEIDETMANIDYAGINNLTPSQNTSDTKARLAKLVLDTTLGKDVDFVEILNTSTEDIVLMDIHFKNGETVNYTAVFDTLNNFNFMSVVTTELYNEIMYGGNF